MTSTEAPEELESVESFRARAEAWVRDNLVPETSHRRIDLEDDAVLAEQRSLMRRLYEARFSGICWPRQYGGLGLTLEHLRAFTEVSRGYRLPMAFHLPTMTILGATLLDFGTEEQKRRYIPAILSGEEFWVQFLSEPTGGSDLAGLLTRATSDGDVYVLSGAKIWSSNAYRCDFALCACRTDWDVPKHAGISVLIVEVHQPGITVEQIRQVNGTSEFCQEFFDDVQIPKANLLGKENDGWAVISRLLQHEKLAVGGGHSLGLVLGGSGPSLGVGGDPVLQLARGLGRQHDPVARQIVGESLSLTYAQRALIDQITEAINTGVLPPPASAILKLFNATTEIHRRELAARLAGPAMVAGEHVLTGVDFLARQGDGLAGGSNEIQRNIISERVLGMPREPAADRGVPFKDVPRGKR